MNKIKMSRKIKIKIFENYNFRNICRESERDND